MRCEKSRILAIVGPTASGKTALSIALAKELGGEIVSCDSMQVYRGMDIGTAKPTEKERDGIPHHMIDIADAHTPFSAAEYVALAREAVEDILSRGRVPVFCGGTGLYLDSFLRGGFETTGNDPAVRERLTRYLTDHGARALHERLREVDPVSAEAIHENNVKRVMRALEIYESTGMTKTEADQRTQTMEAPFAAMVVGLFYPTREILYSRIERRVDAMLQGGLVEETRRLEEAGVFLTNSTAAQAIGYKELLPYLHGEETLACSRERLVRATRHYAKRQLTWFGAKDYVRRIDMERDGTVRRTEDVADEVLKLWNGADESLASE
ncbi:MAG: tRNA (adenosine(37)-N6)-dimethylallyltransferase MiaA [Ruminococcaceae bacterium]|nr:tRNA (adenosine(37)-N6)-dimethylallyltransferase MiaA [Oscillospiraceae bacterium]